MKEIVFYAATSVDNRISDRNNSVSWLDNVNTHIASLDDADPIKQSYGRFYENVDMVIMGRKTYQEVTAMDFPYPYADRENYVVTSDISKYNDDNVTSFIDYQQLLTVLETTDAQKIWICGGAQLFNQLLADQLISNIILTQIPVILGQGARLFDNLPAVNLDLIRITESLPYVEFEYLTKY